MNELDTFLREFSGTESRFFYNHTVELEYEPKTHIYYLLTPDGPVAQDGVTNTCRIIDKSSALIPWACKQMALKILETIPCDTDTKYLRFMRYDEFESIILAAKSAHKEKLDYAAYVGNLAHDWIESYIQYVLHIRNELPAQPDHEQARNCCNAALDWMHRHNVRWIHTEKPVYSRRYGFAGKMDGLCVVDACGDLSCCHQAFTNRLSIADWKSSNDLHTEYLLQTAAYMCAYMEETNEPVSDRWVIRLGKEDGEFDPWHLEQESYETDFEAFRLALELTRTLARINARMKERAHEIRAQRKIEKQKARQEALTIKCNRADRYKGIRRPICNDGSPCQTCLAKYDAVHAVEGES